MFTARKKIQKEKNAEPSEFEESVAQARSLRRLAACLQRLLRLTAHGLGAPRQEPGARQSASALECISFHRLFLRACCSACLLSAPPDWCAARACRLCSTWRRPTRS